MLSLSFPLPAADYIKALQQETELLSREITSLCGTMSVQQLNWKLSVESWSIAQCVKHLEEFNRQYLSSVQNSLLRTRTSNSSTVLYKPGAIGALIMRMVYPGKVKAPAPQQFRPVQSGLPLSVLQEFATVQQQIVELLDTAPKLDLKHIRVASPVTALLRIRLGDVLALLLLHERRHLEQMQRVAHHTQFPRS